MSLNISTTAYRYYNAQRIKETLEANNNYFFVADHVPHANVVLQDIASSTDDILISPYRNMIFGKRIIANDLNLVVKKHIYASNMLYDMYDDQDQSLETSTFYVMVNEGSYYHVWKCLDNNNGANSSVAPSFAAGANTTLYQTSDGYRWKYMTSVPSATADKFVTPTYFPVIANNEVSNNAVSGAIDIIKVENQGARYNNWLNGTLRNANLKINGDPTLYGIGNDNVSFANGFYTGCIVYLTSGIGQGQYRKVVDYIANSTGNIIKIDTEFSTAPLNGTTYELRPNVIITPIDDMPTVNCVARALVNTINSNSIYRIEVLERGAGYRSALAQPVANTIVGVANTATLRPINAPFGGHGYWPFQELYCKDVEVSVSLDTASNTVPTKNQYQQIGILAAPLFANVNVELVSNFGNFLTSETVFKMVPQRLNANCVTVAANATVVCNTANWVTEVQANDYVYITVAGNTINQIVQVNSVVNASHMTLKSPAKFSCTEIIVYKANVTSNAIVSAVNSSNNIMLTNCASNLAVTDLIIGNTSGALGYINVMVRNEVEKGFDSFIQLYKYKVNVLAGTFQNNERLTQGNTAGYLFNVEGSNNVFMYVSNFTQGQFTIGEVVGETSLAIAEITDAYARELVYGSGQVMYLENIQPVPRQNNQTETVQLILNF